MTKTTTRTQPPPAPVDKGPTMKITLLVPDVMIDEALATADIGRWCRARTHGYTIERGGGFTIEPRDDEKVYTFSLGDIKRAVGELILKHPRVFANLVRGNEIGIAGDLLVQLAAFGEVRYV